jgi:asparagine synthase (glutamine-hydrolysing)
MCGIAGFLSKNKEINYKSILENMSNALDLRGPDSKGIWYNEKFGIGLSHTRLSILDLTSQGHQPMISNNNQYKIIFNGEIYNHIDIRNSLNSKYNNINWRSNSDTETLLISIEKIGILETLNSLVGMFAFAIWDDFNHKLTLCRDRIGEKPLYYGWHNDTFIFSSELKAIKKFPNFSKQINKYALSLYFKYNYIPCPYSIYDGIFKLKPGSFVTIDYNNYNETSHTYWDLNKFNKNEKSNDNFNNLSIELEKYLINSVKGQMISDVPIGAFLSGGIDSSLIVSLMQSISDKPIKTFTIGFDDKNHNEAINAKKIANYLNTDHTELYLNEKDILDVIPLLPFIFDEPFSDSSQIPTFLVSKLAKKQVSVVLSGDGGDELFAGYNRYVLSNEIWPKIKFVPYFIRKFIKILILNIKPIFWNHFFNTIKINVKNPTDKLLKFANLLDCHSHQDLYDRIITHWPLDEKIVLGDYLTPNTFKKDYKTYSFIEQMMTNDTLTYLPDDILVKVDRSAMYNSLETRVPFLDHRLIEFSTSIPIKYKINKFNTKIIIRNLLYKRIPKKLFDNKKNGFGVPLAYWLRGPLKIWANELLSENRIKTDGILDYDKIKIKWDEHISGKRNWEFLIWDVLVFQIWYEKNK